MISKCINIDTSSLFNSILGSEIFKSFVEEFNNESPGCYYYMFKIFNGKRETQGVKWFKTKVLSPISNPLPK